MTEPPARIAGGVEFMDENTNVPDDWRDRIDADTLRIDSVCNCVLGQTFELYNVNGFSRKLNELGITAFAIQLGFDADDDDEDYDDLTELWKEYLQS